MKIIILINVCGIKNKSVFIKNITKIKNGHYEYKTWFNRINTYYG